MSELTADYHYTLPPELIAAYPATPRDSARLMVLHRASQQIEHRRFSEFPALIRRDDLVVLNDTRVLLARVFADNGRVELLFVERVDANRWRCMVRPGRKMPRGASVQIGDSIGSVTEICTTGERIIAFYPPIDLQTVGEIPLPPYLGRAAEPSDRERYQTVFARSEGAVAAPTAGLHFTPEILDRVRHTFLTLHVGTGTFRPVQTERISEHRLHPEQFIISAESACAINQATRVVAVGTTTTRVLEFCGRPLRACEGATDLFIHPPYKFRAVDALLTNFHLPQSTLLMLVCAFAGRDFTLRAYRQAIEEGYRFYSYGDCMLIV
jgi:S-adenosylmethionine:tRNA ribosyltransferase-isomerase